MLLLLLMFSTENLDRDQRRNLFAQEQSKKVKQLRIILYWRWSKSELENPLSFFKFFSRHHGSRFFVLHPNHLFNPCLNIILYFWHKFFSGLEANDVATGSWTASKTRCFWAGRRSTKTGNRPFSRSKNSHFSNGEAKCKTFLWKMSVICKKMQNPFHFNCFELSRALKQRLGATPNGLFFCELTMLLRTPSSALAMSSYGAFWW